MPGPAAPVSCHLQAPPMAVLLTLIRACDLATVIEIDVGAFPSHSM